MDYYVYVIELDKTFLLDKRAIKKNPNRNPEMPCVYVGSTCKLPQIRFEEHKLIRLGKKGQKLCSKIVLKYGKRLMPEYHEMIKPLATQDLARAIEGTLAELLRLKGYTVWQN